MKTPCPVRGVFMSDVVYPLATKSGSNSQMWQLRLISPRINFTKIASHPLK
jgi:hypothetical protein